MSKKQGYWRLRAAERDLGGDWRWIWPLPRLRHLLRRGVWCRHPQWSGWYRIDAKGPERIRWCQVCDYSEVW